MNRRILQLAIPSIVSNITVPLLGLVDVTIVGHLGSAAYIGAIAVGGLLFNILYWNFGFLRMGTSGLTSQAYGRKDADAEVKVLVQAVSVGLISAAAILILQYPVERLAFYLLDTSPEVEQYAVTYFRVCIWGAPAVLAMYGFKGWFIGMQNSRFPMYIAIAVNIINIVCVRPGHEGGRGGFGNRGGRMVGIGYGFVIVEKALRVVAFPDRFAQ